MTQDSAKYLDRLEDMYRGYNDQESLSALAEIRDQDERIRELRIFREQPKTQELIAAAITRFRGCIEKLTNTQMAPRMTEFERAYCYAAMDWARFTLEVVGENPELLEQEVEKSVEAYARRAGLST